MLSVAEHCGKGGYVLRLRACRQSRHRPDEGELMVFPNEPVEDRAALGQPFERADLISTHV